MRLWPSHQYVLGGISLTRSEQTLWLQSSQHFKACPADPNDKKSGLHFFPTLATDSQVQADPSLKEKAWHLSWMLLALLASLRPQLLPTRFTGEIWVNFSKQTKEGVLKQALQARSTLSTLVTFVMVQGVDRPTPTAVSHQKRRAMLQKARRHISVAETLVW